MAHKKHPDREHKRYVTDLFVDQVEKVDEIAKYRSEATGKQVSRADIIKEIIDSGLKQYEWAWKI